MTLFKMSENNIAQLLRGLLLDTLRHYVSRTDALTCEAFTPAEDIIIFQLSAAGVDHPKIVGKGGIGFRSLRTLFREIGNSQNLKVDINLRSIPRSEQTNIRTERDRDTSPEFGHGEEVGRTLDAILTLLCNEPVKTERKDNPELSIYFATLPHPISGYASTSLVELIDRIGGNYGRHLYLKFQ